MSITVPVSDEAAGISTVAALMGHPTRAAILAALAGGQSLPAGELAQAANVTASTASEHLGRLVEGGLLSVVAAGRHRYFRLSGASVAQAVEALSSIAVRPSRPRTPRGPSPEMRLARSCYDHLAGVLGVGVTEALVRDGVLVPGDRIFELSEAGTRRLVALGVPVEAARAAKRRFAPMCLDWTERRMHLAGALGAAILDRALELRWVARRPDGRALRVTVDGRRALQRELRFDLPVAP